MWGWYNERYGRLLMSLFSKSDYERESKQNKVVSPRRGSHGGVRTGRKVKLPIQYRSKNHKCSHCTRTDAKKYYLTEKEVRWLCPACVIKNTNSNSKEKPNFIKASKLQYKLTNHKNTMEVAARHE